MVQKSNHHTSGNNDLSAKLVGLMEGDFTHVRDITDDVSSGKAMLEKDDLLISGSGSKRQVTVVTPDSIKCRVLMKGSTLFENPTYTVAVVIFYYLITKGAGDIE